jgi:hypothetical protein
MLIVILFLSDSFLSVVMLTAVKLSVVMLNVSAPSNEIDSKNEHLLGRIFFQTIPLSLSCQLKLVPAL